MTMYVSGQIFCFGCKNNVEKQTETGQCTKIVVGLSEKDDCRILL